MNKTTTRIAAAAALVLLAVLLNPSAQQHRARIKAAVADRNPVAGALGVGALTAFASSYHSLGVASYMTAGDKTVSYGAFGMVFVTG
jgi:hypothetical protein